MIGRRAAALGGLAAAIVLMASCLSVLVARSTNVPTPAAQIEVAAPDFALRDTEGQRVRLSQFRGKAVVLMFTDPRCPVSNEYSGRVMAMTRQFAGQPVQFLAIVSGRKVNDPTYLKEMKVQRQVLGQTFPTLLDPNGEVARLFGATATPSFYLIGRHGMLRYAGAFDDSRDATKAREHYVVSALEAVLGYRTVEITQAPVIGCPIVD